jgi:hypothetical protein
MVLDSWRAYGRRTGRLGRTSHLQYAWAWSRVAWDQWAVAKRGGCQASIYCNGSPQQPKARMAEAALG